MPSVTTVGSQFQIDNLATVGFQGNSTVTGLANGGFAVAWQTPHDVGDGTLQFNSSDIHGRAYGAGGAPAGDEFVVANNPGPSGPNLNPAIAAQGSGFVVSWYGPDPQLTPDPPPAGFFYHARAILGHAYAADGTGGAEFRADTRGALPKPNDQLDNGNHSTGVGSVAGGEYLVAWNDSTDPQVADNDGSGAIIGRLLGTGAPAAEFQINTTAAGIQSEPAVTGLANGNFVVTWNSYATQPNGELDGQIIDGSGNKVGGELVIDGDGFANTSSVAKLADGGFVVTWEDRFDISSRIYNADGSLRGAFDTGGAENAFFIDPVVAELSNGALAVAYNNFSSDNETFVRVVAPDGTFVGQQTIAGGAHQGGPAKTDASLAALQNGQFVVTWTDLSGDGDIAGQIYSANVNFIRGGAGNETFNGVAQTGMFLGFDGSDTVSYATAGAGVTASLNDPSVNTGAAAGDTYGISTENLTGSGFADTLTGNASANILNGGAGADTLRGLAGNDTYYVDNAGDVVNEAANSGTDRVVTSVSYTLAAGQSIETFTPVSFNTTTNINLTGNALAQAITGNAGNNVISDGGAGGADTMSGLGGNDLYIVNNSGDVVNEAASGGTDRVAASVSYTLGAGQSIETLAPTSYSTTTNIDLNGNALAQAIIGNAGKNVIDGKGGNDTLSGMGGNDTFCFDTTPNTSTNDPTITDFSVGADMIELSHAIYTAVALGALSPDAFFVGSAAHDASDRIIYNSGTGALLYDSNGNAAGGVTQFAQLSTGLTTLSASQFRVIA